MEGELGRAFFEGLPPPGVFDCGGLDPELSGYMWLGAGIYLHVGSLGMPLYHV